LKLQPSPSQTFVAGGRYRLAIFDLCDDSIPLDFVGRVLTDCPEDRHYIREAITEYGDYVARIPGCSYTMALFAVR
jgi:hypothetical protein